MTILSVEGLSKYYGEYKAVDRVSFTVEQGRIFGLVGESGSGKTTVGRMIMGLCTPSEGRVMFSSRTVTDSGARSKAVFGAKRKRTTDMQMIFQDPYSSLDGKKSVFSIVSQGLYLQGERDRDILMEKTCQALEMVGLSGSCAMRYPHQFSGGQRQRIAIARCIIMKPRLLIADEPTSALDLSAQGRILALIKELCGQMGMTAVFITHDLGAVRRICDSVGVMYKGRLVETAPTAELFEGAVNGYTKNLLSAVPVADPIYEKNKKTDMQRVEPDEGELVLVGKEHYALMPKS